MTELFWGFYLIIITSLLRLNDEGSYIRNGHLHHPLRCGQRGGGVVLLRVKGRTGVRGHLAVRMWWLRLRETERKKKSLRKRKWARRTERASNPVLIFFVSFLFIIFTTIINLNEIMDTSCPGFLPSRFGTLKLKCVKCYLPLASPISTGIMFLIGWTKKIAPPQTFLLFQGNQTTAALILTFLKWDKLDDWWQMQPPRHSLWMTYRCLFILNWDRRNYMGSKMSMCSFN